MPRPKKDDSAEVYIGEEFIGVLFVDDEDDDRSYNFQMAILETIWTSNLHVGLPPSFARSDSDDVLRLRREMDCCASLAMTSGRAARLTYVFTMLCVVSLSIAPATSRHCDSQLARKAEGEVGAVDAPLAQAHAGRARIARAAREELRRVGREESSLP